MQANLARQVLELKTYPATDRDGYRDETALVVDAQDWAALQQAAKETLNRRG